MAAVEGFVPDQSLVFRYTAVADVADSHEVLVVHA
jgi:hypothetical protein